MGVYTQAMERAIAKQCIADILAAGYSISVNDGEETTLSKSTDPAAIFGAMMTTDEDILFVHRGDDTDWIQFIYGNDGWDVISDYTTNLEDALVETMVLADMIENGDYEIVPTKPLC